MSELLGAAADAARHQEDAAAQLRNALTTQQAMQAKWRQKTRERLGEFVGILVNNKKPPIPLIRQDHDRVRSGDIVQPWRNEFREYTRLGEGWSVRKRGYEYDKGIIPGLFVARHTLELHVVGDISEAAPHGKPHPTGSGEYAITKQAMEYGPDGNATLVYPTEMEEFDRLLAGDEGKDVFGQALLDYDIRG